MTPEQFERWKDFALRMARTCYRHRRSPSPRWIVEQVQFVFDCIPPENVVCLVDWDSSDPYPEGNRFYRRTYRCPCWHCSKVPGGGYGESDAGCPYKCEGGAIYDYAEPYCMGDTMSDWETDQVYHAFYRRATKRLVAKFKARERRDEDAADALRDEWCDRYGHPVRACVRAGMDMVSAPSAGVLGFTAGDLRRMYPDGVPDWITGIDWHVGSLCGPRVPETRPFREWPDEAEVLL